MKPPRTGFEENKTEYWRPINRFFYCQAGYVLTHWNDVASGNRSTTRPNAALKQAPPRQAPAAKLPPARPAKMAPWSPKALPIKPGSNLSSQLAAARVDALANCVAPIRAWAATRPGTTHAEANLLFEQEWLDDAFGMASNVERVASLAELYTGYIGSTYLPPERLASRNAGRCVLQRRIAQLQGLPLAPGAVDGSLTPLSIGGQNPPWKQQGKDARIIASDGKSAMDCVKLVELTKTHSKMGGGGRVLSNQCNGPVEITWCYPDRECSNGLGAMWTVRAGRSWPVSAEREVRWAACHGANSAAFVKGSHGPRYYCSAPAKK